MTTAVDILPADVEDALLLGRVFDPEVDGPCLVTLDSGQLVDVTSAGPTMTQLLETPDLLTRVDAAKRSGRRWALEEVVAASEVRDSVQTSPTLLSPLDLHVIKAAGVTFVESMLERVVEERANGDREAAHRIRKDLGQIIGGHLESLKPGSIEAKEVKQLLVDEGLWSAYLEVGIGPQPEVFTKAPVLSAVGLGQEIGIRSDSEWNNPEPEIVLVVNSIGRIIGVTLGNDVNLRDIEGRSALLLGTAKDNNASCAVGPFIRVLDGHFTLADVSSLDVLLSVEGSDGFTLEGHSSMRNISRSPAELVQHVISANHQYPDGFALFTGTLFSPTVDRHSEGGGFTHEIGDVVRISSPQLGQLFNTVNLSGEAPPWTFGLWELMKNLSSRGLLNSE
jgi:fumarylacetoacetate (FAA) hydrolase family protein